MKVFALSGISLKGVYGRSWKQFARELWQEISEDNVFNGAAALSFYFMLALFPAMLFLLSLIPYIASPNLDRTIMGFLNQLMPGDAAAIFEGTVREVVQKKKGGLLSFGALLTLWSAANGIYAIMQQLNITYDVKEGRSFFKVRGSAILLTVGFGFLILLAFSLTLLGEALGNWIVQSTGSNILLLGFVIARWVIILFALAFAFAMIYYFGPDVEQEFRFITPGSLVGVILFLGASLGFKVYADNLGNYSATYGSIGAVIVLMFWLNIMGLVLLVGSEINVLVEHYSSQGKGKGEKELAPSAA